tara:strand:- start:60 stop:776 length:717 start_codon:yes stop_codon:yes gene_type:complete
MKKVLFKFSRRLLKLVILLVPSSSKLFLDFLNYYFHEDKENELYNLKKLIHQGGNAIDVGANKGLWSYALSKQKKIFKIYSFEPNKKITKTLHNYNCNRIKIYNLALSDQNKKRVLQIPLYKNMILDGWATLERKDHSKNNFNKFKKITIKTKKLDDFHFKNISFIKIDVEGHELSLLRGAKKFFKLNKPNCLIEIKKNNLSKVKKFFNDLNVKYSCVSKKNYSFKFSKENYFFSINK